MTPSYPKDTPLLVKDPEIMKQISQGVKTTLVHRASLIELVETAVFESAYNMGNPTHLVRLTKRTWLVANPENFRFYTNGYGYALSNNEPYKTPVFSIIK